MKSKNKNLGFTLLELLVVISILGMLATIILTSFNTVRGRARDARRISDMRSITTAMELYYSEYGSYPVTPPYGTYVGNTVSTWAPDVTFWNQLSPYMSQPVAPIGEGYWIYIIGDPNGTTGGKIIGDVGCMLFQEVGQGYWIGTRSIEYLDVPKHDGGVSDYYYESYGGKFKYKAGAPDCPAAIFN